MGRRERYVIPPRMLRRYIENQITPPPPGKFKLRHVPPRIRRLQWQQQQQALREFEHARWIERQMTPVDQYHCRQCCCSEFLPFQPALVGRSVMLEQWVLPEQKTLRLKEEEKKIEKEEEKILEEEDQLDYSRLTSFLERDESFLTPWSWKPEENKRQSRIDSYFSFNVRERWAMEKKEIEPVST